MNLNIKFINPNREEDVVQAMAGVLAYNIMNKDENVVFDYLKSKAKSHSIDIDETEEELEL